MYSLLMRLEASIVKLRASHEFCSGRYLVLEASSSATPRLEYPLPGQEEANSTLLCCSDRTFDAAADGYGRGEGCAVVVLTGSGHSAAWAMVSGSAVNQDGRSSGLTAPNGPSQIRLIGHALSSGGIRPQDVSLVAVHGTGNAHAWSHKAVAPCRATIPVITPNSLSS